MDKTEENMAKKEKKVEAKSEIKEERRIALHKKMEKDFGKGSIMGANEKAKYCDVIETGSIGLDMALGIGGLPRGRIVEMYGPESSGKTTLALEVIAKAHLNKDSLCAFIDIEHAIATDYAEKLGVDLDRLDISQPDWGEQALDITQAVIESGDYDVVVIDSVAAIVPKAELEGQSGSAVMASQARLMSQAMRKICASISRTNTIVIFINQLREKIGVMFGNPETTTGGNALKFYASIRLDIRRSLTVDNSVMQDGEKVGNQTTVTVKKNKLAPPFKKCEFNIKYGEGIYAEDELLRMATDYDIITKSGSYFYYNNVSIGQGKVEAISYLKDNPEIFAEIKEKIKQTYVPLTLSEEELEKVKTEDGN